jgi:mannose-6-phosphate isomerase
MAEPACEHQPVRRVEKPWGFEIWFAVTPSYAGKILHINQGEELSLQYHERKDEAITVLSGELELELGWDASQLRTHRLSPGDCQHITPHMIHRMRARTTVEICEVSTPELEDVVRIADRYGRQVTPPAAETAPA